MLRSLGRLNSSPITNIRNTTPNSASARAPAAVAGERQRVGSDQHAHREVAEHRWQLQRAAHHHAEHRGNEVQQNDFERGGHREAPRAAWMRGLECPHPKRGPEARTVTASTQASMRSARSRWRLRPSTSRRVRCSALTARQGRCVRESRARDARMHRPRDRDGHGQERPRRPQDRRHAGLHRHAGVLRAPGRGEPRRPRHGAAGRRAAGDLQQRRERRARGAAAGAQAPEPDAASR